MSWIIVWWKMHKLYITKQKHQLVASGSNIKILSVSYVIAWYLSHRSSHYYRPLCPKNITLVFYSVFLFAKKWTQWKCFKSLLSPSCFTLYRLLSFVFIHSEKWISLGHVWWILCRYDCRVCMRGHAGKMDGSGIVHWSPHAGAVVFIELPLCVWWF